MATIYGLYDKDDKQKLIRYVGQTSGLVGIRVSQHEKEARRGLYQFPVYIWIRDLWVHGSDFDFVVLERDIESLKANERERYWIRNFRMGRKSDKYKLLNISNGGSGWSSEKQAEQSTRMKDKYAEPSKRKKILAQRNRIDNDADVKRRRIENMKRTIQSLEWRLAQSKRMKAKYANPKLRKKIRDIWTAKKCAEHSEKIRVARSTVESKEKTSKQMKRVWDKPGERERRGRAISVARKQRT